ncbi:SPASM domain-containing protein [Patescibacteria group bacterium]|nr:SPASM domain-containing protein [Patescibacteria group bacterium]
MSIQIQQLITKKNISSIRPMVKFCQERKIDLWLNFLDIGNKAKNKGDLDLKKINNSTLVFLEKEITFWIKSMNKPELILYLKNTIDLIRGKKPKSISCPMGSQNFVLDVDGNVYPCFLRKDLCLGNAYREELSKIVKTGPLELNQFSLHSASCVRLGCLCLTNS